MTYSIDRTLVVVRSPGCLSRFYVVDDFGNLVEAPDLFPFGVE